MGCHRTAAHGANRISVAESAGSANHPQADINSHRFRRHGVTPAGRSIRACIDRMRHLCSARAGGLRLCLMDQVVTGTDADVSRSHSPRGVPPARWADPLCRECRHALRGAGRPDRLRPIPCALVGSRMTGSTYRTRDDERDDRQQQEKLLAALDAAPSQLRRDECGWWIIGGQHGAIHTWGDGRSWLACLRCRSKQHWTFASNGDLLIVSSAAGVLLRQRADTEGRRLCEPWVRDVERDRGSRTWQRLRQRSIPRFGPATRQRNHRSGGICIPKWNGNPAW